MVLIDRHAFVECYQTVSAAGLDAEIYRHQPALATRSKQLRVGNIVYARRNLPSDVAAQSVSVQCNQEFPYPPLDSYAAKCEVIVLKEEDPRVPRVE
jgi:hypothetical protein